MQDLAIKRALRIMFQEWKHDNSRASFHYAFALRKSKVVAIGKNNISDGSRTALKIGRSLNINKWKEYPYLHAECDVINQIRNKYSPKEITIISLRINRTGQFRLAKPCQHCQKVLDILGYYNVWWSLTNEDKSGNLILSNNEESINFLHGKL